MFEVMLRDTIGKYVPGYNDFRAVMIDAWVKREEGVD